MPDSSPPPAPSPATTIVRILGCVDEQDGIYEILNGAGQVVVIRWNDAMEAYEEKVSDV